MQLTHNASLALALLTGASLVAAQPASAQNLVTDPSFEKQGLPDWTASGPVIVYGNPHTGNLAIGFAYDVNFASTSEIGHLSQSIPTVAGHNYNVSFWLEENNGAPNGFRATFAGSQLMNLVDVPGNFPYTKYSFTTMATSPTGLLQFDAYNYPGIYSLDDVGITDAGAPVPEASSIISFGLLALGLGGVVIAAKRKKAAASAS